MATHRIFLLHGMGQYGTIDPKDGVYKVDNDGWAKASTAALRASYDTFIKVPYAGGRDFDGPNGIFEIVPINYDRIFETFRNAWAKQIGEDWAKLEKGWDQLGLAGDILKNLGEFFGTAKDDKFGWTHVADIFMYVMPTVRAHVTVQVAQAIANSLAANPMKWSIIAHSLGTSVIHDSMIELNRTIAEYRAKGKFAGGLLPPTVVCSLSNVSRALTNNDIDAYGSALCPSTGDNDRPRVYLNCNHKLDLIAQIDPFQPETPDWVQARKDNAYFDLSNITDFYPDVKNLDWGKTSATDAFMQLIPHGFAHYIAMPQVAGHLWPGLLEMKIVRNAPKIALEVRKENFKKTKKQIEEDKSIEAVVVEAVNAALGNHTSIKDLPIRDVLDILLSHMGAQK